MFSKILFYYDNLGNMRPKPLELTLEMCNAVDFHLLSTKNFNDSIQIIRNHKDASCDPYNNDGRPAGSLFYIAQPFLQFNGNFLTISGFEKPILCWAGLMQPPYISCPECVTKPQYMTNKMKEQVYKIHFDELQRQRIDLIV